MQKGNSNATTTGADGSFSITIQEPSAVLVISFVGFQTKEVAVQASVSDLIVELTPGISSLEDVIVVGYGTQRKQLSTAAVSRVKGDQLAVVPAANISNSLAGRATGIITRANGGSSSVSVIKSLTGTFINFEKLTVDGWDICWIYCQ